MVHCIHNMFQPTNSSLNSTFTCFFISIESNIDPTQLSNSSLDHIFEVCYMSPKQAYHWDYYCQTNKIVVAKVSTNFHHHFLRKYVQNYFPKMTQNFSTCVLHNNGPSSRLIVLNMLYPGQHVHKRCIAHQLLGQFC